MRSGGLYDSRIEGKGREEKKEEPREWDRREGQGRKIAGTGQGRGGRLPGQGRTSQSP